MSFNTKSIDELHNLFNKEISTVELTKATLEDIKNIEAAVDSSSLFLKAALYKQLQSEKGDADNVIRYSFGS